ncbi:class I SAM-dependent methyltransferase [Chitinophaga sp. LS1]|uniref:class I SAM-dependent methyltransferase n=1 Tax=Chitinophaga sp. LS1 TaxID=3051176 RepID=UPI002AAB1A06|nr:class I SAM-dependent methyltransferase [Chitinophaga sp. LS1]WPV65763.1 class I SAM-dependent methyltransferase [Chitinophaga sp. LS1]
MQQTKNNYDIVASQYDWLSKVVFYRSLENAQVSLLKYIPAGSQVLIVGGGTGWILERLAQLHHNGLRITYVELSGNMITLSQKRDYKENTVDFVNLPIEDFTPDLDYDVIITPFLFDNFVPERAQSVFWQLHNSLKKDGLWLFADFYYDKEKSRWWHKLLLKIMYSFFRLFCNIEANSLFNMATCFEQGKYEVLHKRFFYFDFIQSIAYRKPV